MTHVEIAAEQIGYWAAEGMTPTECMKALRKRVKAPGWRHVFGALMREARLSAPAQITAAVRPIPDAGRVA